MRLVDLCAGTGAFSLEFEKEMDANIVFSNDIDESSKLNYDINFNHKLVLQDILNINSEDIPEHDILTGGFPCQPFSIAGKKEGFRDIRSNVFWKIADIIEKKTPNIIILENVKNLLTHDNNRTFATIKKTLEDMNYHLVYNILDTCKITNIPQHRERIYIVGFYKCEKNKYLIDNFNLDFDIVENENISFFLEDNVHEKYYYNNNLKVWNIISENVTKENTVYQYRRTFVRENKSNVCPTLTANMGTGGHNVPIIKTKDGIRKLTPRECFNLQGFDKNYKLSDKLSNSKLYKLAGNSVSIPVINLIIKKLKILLTQQIDSTICKF